MVFSGTNSRYLAEKICNSLGCELGNMNISILLMVNSLFLMKNQLEAHMFFWFNLPFLTLTT